MYIIKNDIKHIKITKTRILVPTHTYVLSCFVIGINQIKEINRGKQREGQRKKEKQSEKIPKKNIRIRNGKKKFGLLSTNQMLLFREVFSANTEVDKYFHTNPIKHFYIS